MCTAMLLPAQNSLNSADVNWGGGGGQCQTQWLLKPMQKGEVKATALRR